MRELDGRRPHADISELEAKGFLRKARSGKGNDYYVVTAEAHAERDKIAERESSATNPMADDAVLDTKGWIPDERELDRGANSVVYIARRDAAVAVLKVCSSWKADAERYQRFVAEIQALDELSDEPGIMRVLDADVPEPGKGRFPWYVMPQGTPLSKLRSEAPLDELIPGLASIADTLEAMHAREYSHRDVKPSNLFAMEDGATSSATSAWLAYPRSFANHSRARDARSVRRISWPLRCSSTCPERTLGRPTCIHSRRPFGLWSQSATIRCRATSAPTIVTPWSRSRARSSHRPRSPHRSSDGARSCSSPNDG